MAPSPEPTSADPREALQALLGAIRRNLVRVVFTTLVFLMIGVALSMIWPKKYESSTSFTLAEPMIIVDKRMIDEVADVPLQKKMAALEANFKSTKRIDSVMDELQWTEWLETSTSPARRRDLTQKIKKNLDVFMNTEVTGRINLKLTFQWTSPDKAAAFVNRLRDSWIKLVLDAHRRGVEEAKEAAERTLLEREADYQNALAARRTYEQENGVPKLGDLETNNAQKVSLMERITADNAELNSIVTKFVNLRAELQLIPREKEIVKLPDDPQQAQAWQKHQAALAEFEATAARYREGSTIYDRALAKVEAADKTLRDMGGKPEMNMVMVPNPEYTQKALQLEAAMARELELQTSLEIYNEQLADVEKKLDRLPSVTGDMERLQADIDAAAALVNTAKLEIQPLREQVRQLRAANSVVGQSSGIMGGGTAFELLESGIEPENPVLPIGAILMAVSLLLGVGFGLLGPVLAEFTRSSFGSVKEVSRNLGVPVLGAVDMILTTRDVRARHVQSVLSITTMALVLVALGTALYIYAFHPEVLPPAVLRGIRDMKMALS